MTKSFCAHAQNSWKPWTSTVSTWMLRSKSQQEAGKGAVNTMGRPSSSGKSGKSEARASGLFRFWLSARPNEKVRYSVPQTVTNGYTTFQKFCRNLKNSTFSAENRHFCTVLVHFQQQRREFLLQSAAILLHTVTQPGPRKRAFSFLEESK